jgi:hypothetical protein
MTLHDRGERLGREGGPGHDDSGLTFQIGYIALPDLTVSQVQYSKSTTRQVATTCRPVNEFELRVRHTDRQRYPGETDTTAQIPHDVWVGGKLGGKKQ